MDALSAAPLNSKKKNKKKNTTMLQLVAEKFKSLLDEKHVSCRDLIRKNILERYETFDIFNLHILNEHSSSKSEE